MRTTFILGIAACAATALTSAVAVPAATFPPPAIDFAVTDDGPYTRHDGGTDQAIAHCGNAATNPAGDSGPNDGDVDSNDGGNRRQGNEPTVAIDPTNPNIVVAGWNDYCQTDLAAGWMGLGFSTDGGTTWLDSTLPGYPLDDSAEGSVSPLKGRTDAGDPLVAFDNDGRLFAGGIAFNRAMPQNGSVFVSTYGANPGPAGPSGQLPKDYLRTLIIDKAGTPVAERHLPGQADAGGGPEHRKPVRGQRVLLLVEVPGCWSDQDLLQPFDRPRCLVLERDNRVRRQCPGL